MNQFNKTQQNINQSTKKPLDIRPTLEQLLQRSDIWQASAANEKRPGIPTGYQQLDEQLHSAGWPADAVTELLTNHHGIGEMRLLMPTLAHLSQAQRWVVLIAPPYIPYAPALAERGVNTSHLLLVHPKTEKDLLWATEQALRSDTCSCVLTWVDKIKNTDLRRLQLAAQHGKSLSFLFRPSAAEQHSSPVALRIKLSHEPHSILESSQLRLQILKQQGGWSGQLLQLCLEEHLQQPRLTASDLPTYRRLPGATTSSRSRPFPLVASECAAPPMQ